MLLEKEILLRIQEYLLRGLLILLRQHQNTLEKRLIYEMFWSLEK
jgi:hypothetical protein